MPAAASAPLPPYIPLELMARLLRTPRPANSDRGEMRRRFRAGQRRIEELMFAAAFALSQPVTRFVATSALRLE